MERTAKRGNPLLLLGLAMLLLMLVAACGEADADGGSSGSTPPTATPTEAPSHTPTPDTIDHPQDADDVVVKIEHVGGFVPQHLLVTRMPHFSLYGDGRVITQGPQIAIYPAPALPNLQTSILTEEGIQEILKAAEEAGLLDGDKEYGYDMIADAATTVFTVTANGETHVVSVYALEMDMEMSDDEMLSAEDREARQKLIDFQAQMLDYIGWLSDGAIAEAETAYEFDQLQIVTQPRDMLPQGDESVDPGEMDWPLETPLAEIGEPFPFMDGARCAVIEGDDLDTLVDALNQGNELTTWLSEGEEYGLLLRPLLPGEDGCMEPQVMP